MITWVVGRGGLLGSAVAHRAAETFDATPVPWQDPQAAGRTLAEDAARFARQVGDQRWGIVWAAGAATTSTPAAATASELATFAALVDSIVATRPTGRGAVFVTSSAGGVYAGAQHPPFDARTPTAPVSPYGDLKVAQETLARERLADVVPLVIGRVSNLYGPGQNLDKLQGLVSALARSAATRQPINIFVPLDTIRDYIYVDDAAVAVAALLEDAIDAPAAASQTVVVASGRPATVGQLIRTMNQITKRKVPVALGMHPSAAAQAADLRVVPTHPLDEVTSLPAGMKSVYLDILERVQQQSLVG